MIKADQPGGQLVFRITTPERFTTTAVAICNAYGLLLFITALFVSIIAVSLLQFSVLSFTVPLLAVAAAAFVLPFGAGNSYIARLAQAYRPPGQNLFLVQLTFAPRLRWGFRAMLEDADDIGWLSCTDEALVFRGDSVEFSIPLNQIQSVRRESGGLRNLFLNPRVAVRIQGINDFRGLRLADRSSLLLPTSRKRAASLYESVSAPFARASTQPKSAQG